MKILLVDSVHPSLVNQLTIAGFECHEKYNLTYQDAIAIIPSYEGLIIRSRFTVDDHFLTTAKKLMFIARAGSGMENIDVARAQKKGIACINSPEGNSEPVGEHALGMILTLLHNIHRAGKEIREGKWDRKGNSPTELMNMTVGIIGYGNTGSAFARKLHGMGVKVLTYDKFKHDYTDKYVLESTMANLYDLCDIVSFHIPLTKITRFMANTEFFEKFRKNIYLINTSRGEVVKTSDLLLALESGKVVGACLDVNEFEDKTFNKLTNVEGNPVWNKLLEKPNVILTPHIAGQSNNSMIRHADILYHKIIQMFPH
ncbi:MAG: hypothetical protein CVU05_10180 [Bacteroidetes bacterium HGW-Bacteroidetes-21]|jgi:D-3-phosphoglycerate dehydrogenase|nr:MAG: hypothetical protein CVU05_10180 [Bacteroidetes bacterium HGW-Bacteroidetes-21]